MPKYVMALDAGTTSNRCVLFDEAGNICSMAQKEFRQFFPNPLDSRINMTRLVPQLRVLHKSQPA